MSWLFFAFLAPSLYTAVTYVDKYILEKEIDDYNAMPIYAAIVAFIAGIIFFILTGFPVLPIKDALIVIVTGVIISLSNILYFKALSYEETSKINFLFQMFPIVTLILSYSFLHETITIKQYLGFLFILCATVAISYERKNGKFNLSQAFFLILLYDVLWATAGVLIKFAITVNSFYQILSYESSGIVIGGIIIFTFLPVYRKAFLKSLPILKRSAIKAIGINEFLFVIAKATTFFAFSLGPAPLVSVIEGTQSFIAVVYGTVLTTLFPHTFKENIAKKQLQKKIFLAIILLIGVVLVT